jgi:hypothetical protein
VSANVHGTKGTPQTQTGSFSVSRSIPNSVRRT